MSAVDVFAADEQSAEPVDAPRWVQLAQQVLAAQGVRGDTELSLLFVDETAMAELNRRFLDRNGPTDVLAFPIDDDDVFVGGRSPDPPGPPGRPGGANGPTAPPAGGTGPFSVATGPDPGRPGSFRDGDDDDDVLADTPTLLGDVVICPAVARRNAPRHAGTYDDEMALLIVHGILHVLGMAHDDVPDAVVMERREQELLDRFHRHRPSQPS